MQTHGLHHLAISAGTTGVEQVAHFWTVTLGLPERVRHFRDDGSLRSVWVGLSGDPQGPFLAIEAHEPERPIGPGMIALTISKPSREAIVSELTKAGIAIELQGRWTFYVRDPAGNRVGLSHHPHD